MFYKQEKSRLGESKPRNLNVRIISATNSDIKAEIENKLSEKTYCIVLIPWKSICLLCENEKTTLYHGALPSKAVRRKIQSKQFFDKNVAEYMERYPWKETLEN
jgi:DNA-binding NtrC family response regulator